MDDLDPFLLSRRVSRALADGVDAAEMRTPLWQHDLHGVVRPSWWRFDDVTTRVSNGVALMSAGHVLAGWASLWASGNTWFDGIGPGGANRDVPILCLPGAQLRTRPGITPWRGLVHPEEVVDVGAYRVSTMARAAFDEMCRAPSLREAVVVLDMATSTTSLVPHTTIDAVAAVERSHVKVRGIVQARKALGMGSPRSASPAETRTRLIAELDAGITGLAVNRPVFDRWGNLLGIPDLLDEETGLVIESDGETHHSGPRTKDNHRQDKLERGLLTVFRVTADDHAERRRTAARMNVARRDAATRPRDRWTTETPTWWPTWKHAHRWQ